MTSSSELMMGETASGLRLPPEAPLAMPIQDFWSRRAPRQPAALGEAELWQMGLFILAASMALFGGWAAFSALQTGGVTPLEGASLFLFEILFAWIAYALASALIGFGVSLGGDAEPAGAAWMGDPALRGRTAILMPVHNEDPAAVCLRLRNMDAALRGLGAGDAFHIFLLSDTRQSEIRRDEQAAFAALARSTGQEARLFYRWREDNVGRKAGNIADWVRRFGGAYPYMVVLDADSVMTGETLVRLAALMEEQPRTGLIQTVPRLVNRQSVFGRVQQFASRLYGPMLSDGLAHTSGCASNYWGHNAIIRTHAFAAHAGLPTLSGPRPFGGEIRSHDFVEAALLRRAGWDVRLEPHLAGSFEECPPTLPDLMIRERRWCQGNLQHLPLVAARGLHWMSRIHLAQGVLTYLMPPLWLLFLVVGALRSAEATYIRQDGFDDYAQDMLKWLLAVSLLSLFIPRALALIRALARSEERRAWGDPLRLAAGVVLEAAMSALLAPILMTAQTVDLVNIFRGRDSGWTAQQRTDEAISWREAARRFSPHTAAGVLFASAAVLAAPQAALWTLPVALGLIFSIPLVVVTSDPVLGGRLARLGLFVTPEERAPAAELQGLSRPVKAPEDRNWRLALDRLLAEVSPGVVDA